MTNSPSPPVALTGLTEPRLTHVALPVADLDASVDFYTTIAPLVVVHRHAQPEIGRTAWVSNNRQVIDPFVIVLTERFENGGAKMPILQPFAHLGVEMPTKEDVDRIAAVGAERGVLYWEPRQMPNPILGYLCALKDPDGNVVEFSCNQDVFTTVRELWGTGLDESERSALL
jgi:catechol 2,3-dioxygenase-like lactoylglutathione lyase family enzyme